MDIATAKKSKRVDFDVQIKNSWQKNLQEDFQEIINSTSDQLFENLDFKLSKNDWLRVETIFSNDYIGICEILAFRRLFWGDIETWVKVMVCKMSSYFDNHPKQDILTFKALLVSMCHYILYRCCFVRQGEYSKREIEYVKESLIKVFTLLIQESEITVSVN